MGNPEWKGVRVRKIRMSMCAMLYLFLKGYVCHSVGNI